MPVHCSHCGEELLGAVNRCWRCGTPFVSRPGPAELPPVRRAPVEISGDVKAELSEAALVDVADVESDLTVGDMAATASTSSGETAEVSVATADSNSAATQPVVRRGSPFAVASVRPAAAVTGQPAIPHSYYGPATNYPRHAAAIGGAIAALLLGVLSLVGAFYIPLGALITSVVGLVMGAWGLYSERRGVAIAGLLLCCVALTLASYNGAVELYTHINGHSPWEAGPNTDVLVE
jgi:hypothetical protein